MNITDRDRIEIYLKDVRNTAIMSAPELIALYQAAQTGCTASRELLITSNLRMVITFAKKYGGIPLEDLIQAGNEGLVRSIEKFDINKSKNIVSFMNTYINRQIKMELANTKSNIRIPINRQRGLSLEDSNPAFSRLISLDIIFEEGEGFGSNQQTYGDMVIDEDDATEYDNTNEAFAAVLRHHLDRMKPAYQEVLRLHYFEGMSLADIGQLQGKTREAVRQNHEKGLAQMRKLLGTR